MFKVWGQLQPLKPQTSVSPGFRETPRATPSQNLAWQLYKRFRSSTLHPPYPIGSIIVPFGDYLIGF